MRVPSQMSLRRTLWVSLAFTLALAVGVFAVVVGRVVGLGRAESEARSRSGEAFGATDDEILAVVDERDALLDYQRAHQPAALAAAEAARGRETSAAERRSTSWIAGTDAALEAAIVTWRLRALSGAPAALAAVRDAAEQLRAAIRGTRRARTESYRRDVAVTVVCAVLLIALGVAFAVGTVVWILRRTATPLEALQRAARDGTPFVELIDRDSVREVGVLALGLHKLTAAVRDKEHRLAEAHADAVELSRFGEHVQQVIDEAELQETIARRLAAVSGASAVHILRRHSDEGRLDVAFAAPARRERLHLPILADPMRCRAVRTLKPVFASSNAETACHCPLVPDNGSYLCEPMLAAGELVGVVNLQADLAGRFTQRVERKVRASLGFGATAMASLRLLATTRERGLRDPLTGAYNRGFLAEHLPRALAEAQARGGSIAILAIDLDHFKVLNDGFGHTVGDRALVAAVQTIQREIRSADALVRAGGEEFVVVLADTDRPGALEAGERIRAAIAAIDLPTDRGRPVVHASIGVASYPEHGRQPHELLDAADRALYAAKDGGRDRVVAAAAIARIAVA